MAYQDDKLQKLTFPTLTNLNWYSYQPDNGDVLADVVTAGYFTNCRYIESEYGWANATIVTILDDGYYFLQVDDTEITASQVSAGGADITSLVAAAALLRDNLSGVENVNMGAADYTLTASQAQAQVLVVSNVGDGTKTLTWPTASDGTWPILQLIVTIGAANYFTISHQSGGVTADLIPGTMHIVSVSSSFGAYNVDNYTASCARSANNGTETLIPVAGDTVLTDYMTGRLLIANDAAPQTLTINAGLMTTNLITKLYCTGAGGVTVTAGAGVTVTGNAILAANGSCDIIRDALTETYRCV